MIKIIVFSTALKEQHVKMIEEAAARFNARVCFINSEDGVPEDFKDADVVYGNAFTIAGTYKSLRWLCSPNAGIDKFLVPGFFANPECILSNSSGSYGVSIAEHIIAQTLMMMRKITLCYKEACNGIWGPQRQQDSIKDSRITCLGTGDIGRTFASRARAFQPRNIIGVSRSGKCDDRNFDKMLKIDELDSILPETDLLVMSLPGTPETENILTKERINLMPKGSYIVNVGRGSAIDEDALAEALLEGHIAGAALDVFKIEPLPKESKLWNVPNLLITPHVAGNMTLLHTINRNVEMFCEDLENYANNRPLRYMVDKNKGY
ncbi:MAG: D-2-hydroxyacid dehydrogenase [Lachnospiraceae bacterium]|nr:D-2-hydroxyacid dehydrogenase [Lachnospiraceae bacterium]